jgi:hypothetical protein
MSFNFKQAKEAAKKALKNPLLEIVILGSQGAGKSYTIGTLGVKTLYLYGTRETHGPKAASVKGTANIEPMCIDFGIWPGEKVERQFTADESWKFLTTILEDFEYLKSEGYKAIALDGLAVLDELVKGTTAWKEACKTASGKHNNYGETAASQSLIGQMINRLKACQRELGVHIVVTGILDVKSVDAFGGIEEASPRLSGYGLAESLNSNFGDIAVVGKMTKGGEIKYKFQFLSDLTRASKDDTGNIKRAMNFSPRLSGCETVPYMDADLSKLAAYKKEQMK